MRDHEEEPAQVVLDRLRNNPPVPPSTSARVAPDLDYPRRKEAWDHAVAREEARVLLEQEGFTPKRAGEVHAKLVFPKLRAGAQAGGPEVPSAEEQEKTKKAKLKEERAKKNKAKAARKKKR